MSKYIEQKQGISLYEKKILDTISVGCGTSYQAKDLGHTSVVKANDVVKYCTDNINIDNAGGLAERMMKRIVGQELQKQENLDRIVQTAIDLISDNESVNSMKVRHDWATRFVNYAEQVSEKEMQAAWAKVLSQEVSKPGAFSLRTLDVLRNMSKEEAELFLKICQFILRNGNVAFLPNIKGATDLLECFDISYDDILKMEEVGLVNSAPDLVGTFTTKNNKVALVYSDVAIVYLFENPEANVSIGMFVLTKAGRELSQIIETKRDDRYIKQLAERMHVNAKNIGICKLSGQNENGEYLYDDDSFVSILKEGD